MDFESRANGNDISVEFLQDLKELYDNEVWKKEGEEVVEIVCEISAILPENYQLESPAGKGGSGLVLKVKDSNIKEDRALKVARPLTGNQQFASEAMETEKNKLLSLSHKNLINIYYQGAVSSANSEYPFYIMDWVDEDEADEFFEETPENVDTISIFEDIIQGFSHLHEEQILHSDIKPENILIDDNNNPIIIDFGFAKSIDRKMATSEETYTGGTRGYIHPRKRDHIEQMEDENRVEVTTPRDILKEYGEIWDLYSLGITFLEILDEIEQNDADLLSRYQKRYLRLMACRMLDGENSPQQTVLNLSRSAFEDISYSKMSEVNADIQKLIGTDDITTKVPEIDSFSATTLTVSNVDNLPFTNRVEDIVNHQLLNRLGSITQLGLMNLLYPSANHSRLEHVIGTFSILCDYITSLRDDPVNPIFRQIMDAKDIEAILVAGLVSDIGQFPIAYDINQAIPDIDARNITVEILEGDYRLEDEEERPIREVIEDTAGWDIPIERVIGILQADPARRNGELKDRILHTLLKGPLGADRIDYLRRDAHNLGLPYGNAIELDRLTNSLTIVFEEQSGETYAALGIHEEGKIAAETIGFVHYSMFGEAYWHNTFRAIKVMIYRLVWEAFYRAETKPSQSASFVGEFIKYVKPGPGTVQQTFDSDRAFVTSSVEKTSQVDTSDLEVLRWFAHHATDNGEDLYDKLESRDIFNRVNVFTQENPDDQGIWGDFAIFYRKYSTAEILKMQEAFQEIVVEKLREDRKREEEGERAEIEDDSSNILTADRRDHFIKDGSDTIILLVDLPPEDKVLEEDVEYIKEEDRRRTEIEELEVENLKGTAVWEGLQTNFHESIGKLRVYCHPEHSNFFSAYFDRTDVRDMLQDALNEVPT